MHAQVKRSQTAVKQERLRQQQTKLNQARAAINKCVNKFDVNLGQIRMVCDENMVQVQIMVARVRDYIQM